MRLFGFCSEKSHKSIMEVSFLAALSFLYQIFHSIGETLVVQLCHVSQFSSESHQAVYFQRRTNLLFQKVENLGGRHVLTFLLVVGRFEVETEILVYRLNYLKLAVALHDELHLLGVEITLLAIAQRHKRLGEKLLVVGADTHVDGARQLDADETAVAGWVGEDVVHVARGDEGGEAWKLHDVTSVRRLVFQRR